MLELIWVIPLVYFASAAVNGLLGPKASKGTVNAVSVGGPLVGLLLSLGVLAAYLGTGGETVVNDLYSWTAGDLSIDVAFLLDPLAAVMLFVVTFVGFLIHVYSAGYMGHHDVAEHVAHHPNETGYQRYFAYLNLFMGAMLLPVLGENFLVSFVGWEGVGLCSYLLIGFYYRTDFAPQAGRKAFIVNRIGDFAFLIGMFLLAAAFGTLSYPELFGEANREAVATAAAEPYAFGLSLAAVAALCLFIGAMGKSAQIPLYVWLPDAMAGPTPVSALIHAATMVTAGVYIVVRSNLLFQLAPGVGLLVASIGAATALFAATIALAQNDIKKVLAYSTVSQLGYMFLAAGVGAYTAAIFHVFTHAFFKALLFLGSGSVIHAMGGEQDMRAMGGLKDKLPSTFRTWVIATLAIAGVPPLAGFFSKDEILASAAGHGHWILWGVGFATAGLTAFYMGRATIMTFFGEFRGTEEQRHHLHESPASMTIPLWILAAGSALVGLIGIPAGMTHIFHLPDVNLFHHFLEPVIADLGGEPHVLGIGLEIVLILLSIGAAVGGLYLAWMLYRKSAAAGDERVESTLGPLYPVLQDKYYVDEVYDLGVVRPLAQVSEFFWKVVDGVVIEGAIRLGTFVTELAGDFGRFSTTGNVRNYALYFFVGVLVLFAFLFV
jgi:NADH-quinone oxidoreductase subunit L